MVNTKEIIDNAVKLIEKGWIRGTYKDGNRYCLRGAIREALKQAGQKEDSLDKLIEGKSLRFLQSKRYKDLPVPGWASVERCNDLFITDKQEAIKFLKSLVYL